MPSARTDRLSKGAGSKPPHSRLQLAVVRNGETVAKHEFPGPKITIGRAPNVELKLDDPYISGHHCSISIKNNRVVVQDNGSRNGICVNGSKVGNRQIQDGDAVKVGRTFVVVNFLNGLRGSNAKARKKESLPYAPTMVDDAGHEDKTQAADSDDLAMSFDRAEATMVDDLEGKKPSKKKKAYNPNDFDDEEKDEFDRNFVSPFSLAKELSRKPLQKEFKRSTRVLQILSIAGESIISREAIGSNKSYFVYDGPAKRRLVRSERGGFRLFFFPEDSGHVILNGRKKKLSTLTRSAQIRQERGGLCSYSLSDIDQAVISHKNRQYHMRLVDDPHLPVARFNFALSRETRRMIGISFLTHVLAIAVVSLVSARVNAAYEKKKMEQDRFVKLDLKELQVKKPEPPKPPPVKKAEVKQAKAKPKPKIKPKPKRRVAKKPPPKRIVKKKPRVKVARKLRPAPKRPSKPKVNVAKTGVLGALSGLNKQKSKNKLVSAMTNLSGVKARGGTQTFSISALQGKTDSDDVTIMRIGDLKTKGATGIGSRSYGVAAISGKKGKGSDVVGVVVGDDAITKPAITGGLTRAQVLKVIQEHISEINYCYEKGLMENPSLAGKMTVDWAITAAGTVNKARIKFSELRNGQVHSCMTRTIKSWKFPRAKKGIGTDVNFPFVFNNAGF